MIIDHAEYTGPTRQHEFSIRVLAIYQILLGWKTYKCYYKTDELPNPKANPNPRKIRLKSGIWATFSHSKQFFVGWDWFYIGNRLQERQTNKIIRKEPYTGDHINQDLRST